MIEAHDQEISDKDLEVNADNDAEHDDEAAEAKEENHPATHVHKPTMSMIEMQSQTFILLVAG